MYAGGQSPPTLPPNCRFFRVLREEKHNLAEEEARNTPPTPEKTEKVTITHQEKGNQPTTANTKRESTINNNNTTKITLTAKNKPQEDTLAQDIQEHMEAAHVNRKDTNKTWEEENKAELELNNEEDWHDD